MIEAVMFDVDGVLVHPWRFRKHLAHMHGIRPSMTAPFFRGPFVDCVLGKADLADRLEPVLPSWGWRRSAADFIDEWFAVENAPHHEVLSIVTDLRQRNVPCFVASTQERRRARYLTDVMGFGRLFDGLFFSCDVGAAKPAPSFFEAVARQIDKPPTSLLLVDDALENVSVARTCGWQAEHFTSPEQLRARLSTSIA